MNILADAAINVQKIERVAEKLGLTADLVDGVGDYLYEAVTSQLDLASKIVERSQIVADRVLSMSPPFTVPHRRLARVEVTAGQVARVGTLVSNTGAGAGDVLVNVTWVSSCTLASKAVIGRRRLEPGEETFVEVSVITETLKAGDIVAGAIRATLQHGDAKTDAGHQNFEIWVRG